MMKDYYDYLLALCPTERAITAVKKLREQYCTITRNDEAYGDLPYINIQLWPCKLEEWIEPLLPKLQRDLQHMPPITFEVDGFSYHKHDDDKATLFAKLSVNESDIRCVSQLKKLFNKAVFEPQMALASNIKMEEIEKLLLHFINQPRKQQLSVLKLAILKKKTNSYSKNYQLVKVIAFNELHPSDDFGDIGNKNTGIGSNKLINQQFSLF